MRTINKLTNPLVTPGPGFVLRATLVVGERSHRCVIAALTSLCFFRFFENVSTFCTISDWYFTAVILLFQSFLSTVFVSCFSNSLAVLFSLHNRLLIKVSLETKIRKVNRSRRILENQPPKNPTVRLKFCLIISVTFSVLQYCHLSNVDILEEFRAVFIESRSHFTDI